MAKRTRKPDGGSGGRPRASEAFLAEFRRSSESLRNALYAVRRSLESLRVAQVAANAVARPVMTNASPVQTQTIPGAVPPVQPPPLQAQQQASQQPQQPGGNLATVRDSVGIASDVANTGITIYKALESTAMQMAATIASIVTAVATTTIAIVTLGGVLTPIFNAITGSLAKVALAFGVFAAMILNPALIPPILAFGAAFAVVYAALKVLGVAVSVVSAAFSVLTGAIRLAYNVVMALPRAIIAGIKAIPAAVVGIVSGLYRGIKNVIVGTYEAIVSGIQKAFSALVAVVKASVAFLFRAITDPSRTLLAPLVAGMAGAVNAVSRSFSTIGGWIDSISTKIGNLGGTFSGWASRITGPMEDAARTFADIGKEAADMAQQSGLSVKSLTELGYAAKQFGASQGDVSGAAKSANAVVAKAASGDADAAKPIERLGFSPDQLSKMPSEQRFIALGRAIAAVADPAERASIAMAVFGSSGEKLLPMLANGEAGLAEFRIEAQKSGLVLTGPAADAAKLLAATYERLKDSIAGFWLQIGATVAPIITETTETIARAVQIATRWASENRELIATVFRVASAVGTVGSVLTVVAGVLGGGATVASLVAGSLASVATTITVVGGAIVAVLSPIGLLVAGLSAVAVYFGRSIPFARGFAAAADAGSRAWGSLGPQLASVAESVMRTLGQMRDFAARVMGGIEDAIRAGNLGAAVEIAWTAAKVAWANALHWIAEMTDGALGGVLNLLAAGKWGEAASLAALAISNAFNQAVRGFEDIWLGLRDTFDDVLTFLQTTWNTTFVKMRGPINEFINTIRDLLFVIADYDVTGVLAKKCLDINAKLGALTKIGPKNPDETNRDLNDANERRKTTRAATTTATRTATDLAAGAVGSVGPKIDSDVAGANDTAAQRIKDLQDQLDRAIADAADMRKKAGIGAQPAKGGGKAGFNVGDEQRKNIPSIEKPQMGQPQQMGSFSAAAFMAMGQGQGGGGPMEKLAKTAEEQKALALKQIDQAMKLNSTIEEIKAGLVA